MVQKKQRYSQTQLSEEMDAALDPYTMPEKRQATTHQTSHQTIISKKNKSIVSKLMANYKQNDHNEPPIFSASKMSNSPDFLPSSRSLRSYKNIDLPIARKL
jgi:hypothetical protein